MKAGVSVSYLLIAAVSFLLSGCHRDLQIDASGNFEATEITISAEADGIIKAFKIEEGQQLKRNELLGYIDTTQLQLNKEQLIASANATIKQKINITSQLDVLNQQLENLLREKNRFRKLVDGGAATQQQLELIEDEIKVTQKQIAAQRSLLQTKNASVETASDPILVQVRMINDRIRHSYILNPIHGVVLKKFADCYEFAYRGKPLYKIADLSTMFLKIYLTSKQLELIRVGQRLPVFIDKADNIHEISGKVTWISTKAEFTPKNILTRDERVSQVYAVKLSVPNEDGSLRIGMFGQVRFMPFIK